MPKITFIGAGSTVFAKNLMGDILSYPELAGSTISLHDIDHERLRTSSVVAHKVAETLGVKPVIDHHRPAHGAGRRRLCHFHDSSRRLQTWYSGRF